MSSYDQFDEGKRGESYTRLDCSLFLDSKIYRKYHDILIPAKPRSTQIDHIIVSEYGIFVIETKSMKGLIYGDARNAIWTQVFQDKQYRFQNPLRQNYLHTQVLAKFLEVGSSKMFPVVVFWGDCEFRTDMPENVRKRAFIQYIKRKKEKILNPIEVQRVCRILHDLKEKSSDESRQQHIDILRSATVCPRCGGKLMERIARKGNSAGIKFIGCANYPQCKYSRDLNNG